MPRFSTVDVNCWTNCTDDLSIAVNTCVVTYFGQADNRMILQCATDFCKQIQSFSFLYTSLTASLKREEIDTQGIRAKLNWKYRIQDLNAGHRNRFLHRKPSHQARFHNRLICSNSAIFYFISIARLEPTLSNMWCLYQQSFVTLFF